MTERSRSGTRATRRCRWCGAPFAVPPGPGRPPRYCRRSHRQRRYEAERRGRARGLGVDETVVSTSSWEAHRDAVYILETAVEDAEGDLAEATSLVDLHTAVEDLVRAAREVLASAPEPHAIT